MSVDDDDHARRRVGCRQIGKLTSVRCCWRKGLVCLTCYLKLHSFLITVHVLHADNLFNKLMTNCSVWFADDGSCRACTTGEQSRVRVTDVDSVQFADAACIRWHDQTAWLLLVSRPSGLLTMRLYDPSLLLSVPSHLHCRSDVHIPRFQIFLYIVCPCFLVAHLYSFYLWCCNAAL